MAIFRYAGEKNRRCLMGRIVLKLILLPLLLAVLLLALALFLVPYLATWLTMRLISLRFFLQSKVFA